ncbi:MAG: 3-phosphoshikimate 1-carboxyvinyltransferase [Treponema sp.]|nr:MAG: 3-phosphoshikimate 1-carboxyvinyltransferase [Treponema sp.]
MNLNIFASRLTGTAEIPPSKSHSIRAIILASFAVGNSIIHNVLNSKDINSVINAMKLLGVKLIQKNCTDSSFTLEVIPPKNGLITNLSKSDSAEKIITVDAGNSGSMLYFLAVIFCFIPNKTFVFTGDASLSARPIQPIIEVYKQLGIRYETNNSNNKPCLPLTIFTGDYINKKQLDNSCLKLNMDGIFSQVVSGVFLATSIFGFKTHIKLAQVGEMPYLKMTCNWVEELNIKFKTKNFNDGIFELENKSSIKSFRKTIPSDWSSASFLIAASVITNSQINIKNLNYNDGQGDAEIIRILNRMGANIKLEDNLLIIKNAIKLKGITIDCAEIPDLVPLLALIACFADGKTELINAQICRFKECDRLSATCNELKKLGASITEKPSCIRIHGRKTLKPACVESYSDHRIAMMLAVAGLAIKSDEPLVVKNFECFNISFPNFISTMKKLGANFIRS